MIGIRSFAALIKIGKDFKRNHYIKIMSPVITSKIWTIWQVALGQVVIENGVYGKTDIMKQ